MPIVLPQPDWVAGEEFSSEVVSEETGTISLAVDGKLRRNYDYSSLKKELFRILGDGSAEQAELKNNRNND